MVVDAILQIEKLAFVGFGKNDIGDGKGRARFDALGEGDETLAGLAATGFEKMIGSGLRGEWRFVASEIGSAQESVFDLGLSSLKRGGEIGSQAFAIRIGE